MLSKEKSVLKDIVIALLDKSQTVRIETLMPEQPGSKTPRIPERNDAILKNGMSKNHLYADSISIGPNITIKRIHHDPIQQTTRDGKQYSVDTGWHYVVRTQHGDAMFAENDNDFGILWGAALNKADRLFGDKTESQIADTLSQYLSDKELRDIARQGPNTSETKNKYDQAVSKLKSMGIPSDRLADYIANKKQNE